MRQCSRAIILNDKNQLLVFERTRQHTIHSKIHHYYSIPGGGIEKGETPEQAVVRELREEMSIDIQPLHLLVHQIDKESKRENYYFLARITDGTPTFNQQSEEALRMYGIVKNSYAVIWTELDNVLLGYYEAYDQVVAFVKYHLRNKEFPSQAVDMTVEKK